MTLLGLSLGVPADQAGCGAPAPTEEIGHSSEALTAQNGLTTNGLRSSIILNGIRTIILNGLRPIILNGLRPIILNGVTLVSQQEIDEVVANLTSTEQALLPDGTPATNPDGSPMTKGAAARKLLQYIYECALPPTSTMTLTINGVTYPETYQGQLALAPAWETGACDTSCQHWISACVLARTNALGVHVPISLRGNHPSLNGVPPEEAAAFPIREGAFFGNLFVDETLPARTSDTLDACVAQTSRRLTTCSGGGNPGALTERFCAGGSCGIFDIGACQQTSSGQWDYWTCEAPNADGAFPSCSKHCDVSSELNQVVTYPEVITSYLQDPFPACGNRICDSGETHQNCPTDCYDGAATKLASGTASDSTSPIRVAADGSLVFGARTITSTSTSASLIRRRADGTQAWTVALNTPLSRLALDSTGNAIVATKGVFDPVNPRANIAAILSKVSTTGSTVWSKSVSYPIDGIGVDSQNNVYMTSAAKVSNKSQQAVTKYSASGSALWTVYYPPASADTIATGTVDKDGNFTLLDVGVLYHLNSSGKVVWSKTVPGDTWAPTLVADVNGDVFYAEKSTATLSKYAAATGALLWTKTLSKGAEVMEPDGAGGIFVSGSFTNVIDLGGGQLYDRSGSGDIYLGHFDASGALVWSTRLGGDGADVSPQLARSPTGSLLVYGEFSGTTNLNVGTLLTSSGGSDTFLLTILSTTFAACTTATTATCDTAGGAGFVSNACGGVLICGDGGPGCIPRTCGTSCGDLPDGCGGILHCSPCVGS